MPIVMIVILFRLSSRRRRARAPHFSAYERPSEDNEQVTHEMADFDRVRRENSCRHCSRAGRCQSFGKSHAIYRVTKARLRVRKSQEKEKKWLPYAFIQYSRHAFILRKFRSYQFDVSMMLKSARRHTTSFI